MPQKLLLKRLRRAVLSSLISPLNRKIKKLDHEPAHTNPSMALLQVRLVQEGLKALEYTSHGPCSFSSVAHSQLYNDPSYDINVRAAGVEHIRKNRQKYIGPITELLWMCCHSNVQGVMHLLFMQAVSDAL